MSDSSILKNLLADRRRLLGVGLLAAAAVAIFAYMVVRSPDALDYDGNYRLAANAFFSGPSMYTTASDYYAPPWAVIPLIPFAALPLPIGRALWFVVSLGLFAYTCYRLGGKPVAILAFLLSPMVANCLIQGNIESLALIGLVLPPHIGLIFLAMKPQTTAAVILFYLVEAWRNGGLKLVLRTFWPVALVGALSLVFFGLWPLRLMEIAPRAGPYNISLWPKGIPIAAALLVAAFRGRKRDYALMASPFLAPYTVLMSWGGALAALSGDTLVIVAVSLSSWVFWILYRLPLG